jgi:signal transduction histidine kinase/ActR/RegA family two-component response regulator
MPRSVAEGGNDEDPAVIAIHAVDWSEAHPSIDAHLAAERRKYELYRLTDRLHHASSLDAVHEAALDAIVEALPCDRGSILLADSEGVMRFVASRALSDQYRARVEGHSPWAPGETRPRPVVIADVTRADLSPELRAAVESERIGALLFIPLITTQGLLGKFMAYWNGAHAVSREEIQLSLTIARQLSVAIERRRGEEALRSSEQRLREELADTQLLQRISAELIDPDNQDALYEKIVDAAMAIMHSEFGSMQMLHPERGNGGELQLLASRGFNDPAADAWQWVRLDAATACARALRDGDRVIVPDAELCEWMIGTEDLRIYLQAGIRAVQTTPLLSRTGRMVGMISTHWREPHSPSQRDLRLLDILARQAADLIERRRAETALAQSEARLREDDRRKDEFLAMLAHELRNPLAPIVNAVHLLDQRKSNDRLQQHARDIIRRQALRLTRLVDDLLEVSRITSGRIQLHFEPITFGSVIERAIESTRPMIEQRRHALQVVLPEGPVWLHGDATRLEQVVVNLLTNAAKYTDDGGLIRVTATTSTNEAVLKVGDNGIGIEPDLLPRIFELFTQAERSLDRSSGGLGIGLALVQKVVSMHGGSVTAESTLGQGTELTIRLPLAAAPAASSVGTRDDEADSIGPLRVLVVDDNVDAAQSFGLLLEGLGHRVLLAYDGAEALAAVQQHAPQIVFLDIGLPTLNGYEVARLLRQDPAHREIVLVALTGYGQHSDRERAHAAGFDHHLVKPVYLSAVEQILAAAAESPQL